MTLKNVVLISGSPTSYSRLDSVLMMTRDQLNKKDINVSSIQVCELPPEDLLFAKWNSPSIQEANDLIKQADGLIIGTPIYKASFSGVLKTFLDLIPEMGFSNKILLPLAIGGTPAHLLMLEYGLKPILSVLGATSIENGVFIQDVHVSLNESGETEVADIAMKRLIYQVDSFTAALFNHEALLK